MRDNPRRLESIQEGPIEDLEPAVNDGRREAVVSLRGAKSPEDLKAVLRAVQDRFAGQAWALQEAAGWATRHREWKLLADLARELVEVYPTLADGYRAGAVCLMQTRQFTEAEALLRQAMANLGPVAWAMADHARLARMQADWHEARRRWEAYRLACPDRPEGYVEGAIALRGLAEFDLADALLGQAAGLFPNHAGVLDQFARVAQGRRDWVECDRRWQLARAACPGDKTIALAHAESPARGLFHGKRDWDEAFRRFDALHAAFPDLAEGYIAHLRNLCKAKRYERASEVATAAIARLPDDVGVVLAVAQISEACGKLQEAAAHYQRACDAFPASHAAPVRLAATLAKLGRTTEADALCEAAIERFPAQPEVFCEYAELAMLRHDWAVAHDRWAEAAGRFPFDPHIRKRLHHASLALADSAGQHAASPVTAAQGRRSDAPMTLAELISCFESLGGTRQGCEFGLVQRALGAEPLGLLRWMHITLDGLVACLETDFEGVGTPAQTELGFLTGMQAERNEVGDDPEYVMTDRRYRMSGHTFTRPSQIPFEKMFAQSCRRMAFLRRKLLDDLAAGEKIFVFKLGDRVLSDDELDRLYRALRRHGDTTLLYVRSRTDTHPSGSAELVKPGLIVGYIERFSVDEDDVLRAPDLPAWTSICKEAWRLVKKRKHVLF